MTIEFIHESGYVSPGEVATLDFVFPIYPAGIAVGSVVLSTVAIAGYGTTPDRAVGDFSFFVPYINGVDDESWEGTGLYEFPSVSLTASMVVNNPYTIPSLIVSGYIGVNASLAIPSISILGTAEQSTVGFITLPAITGTGIGSTEHYALSEVYLPKIKIAGYTGLPASYVLPSISISSTAETPIMIYGNLDAPKTVVEGTLGTVTGFEGDLEAPRPSVSGTILIGSVLSGNLNAIRVIIDGELDTVDYGALVDGYLLGDLDVPKALVNGVLTLSTTSTEDTILGYSGDITCQP